MGDKKPARSANKMNKLAYNCTLENEAFEAAQQKPTTSSVKNENVFVIKKAGVESLAAAKQVLRKWYQEIETGAMRQATGTMNIYTPELKLPNFAKMVWDSITEVGCAVHSVESSTYVVCRYSKGAGVYGDPIYTMGPTCRRCATCVDGALCQVPEKS
ncbi:hypothetical protein Y032_0010g992 [Ancylostoma ceylanicum]|uniref:SCP domain-containing protein n=1 Tax=Ancylostoma ceylanicum TaxID=53326 RepID=A0A016VHQ7_9BILA|nr:hypothetical protein Y032_0010g992 [Ancylostoma ceylanicum]